MKIIKVKKTKGPAVLDPLEDSDELDDRSPPPPPPGSPPPPHEWPDYLSAYGTVSQPPPHTPTLQSTENQVAATPAPPTPLPLLVPPPPLNYSIQPCSKA